MKRALAILAISFLAALPLRAQMLTPEVISSSGGTSPAGMLLLEWTLGEVSTETYESGTLTLTEGFHQPQFVITTLTEEPDPIRSLSVYPNPTEGIITIELSGSFTNGLSLLLTDISGKTVLYQPYNPLASGTLLQLDLHDLPNGIYVLTLTDGSGYLLSNRIEKIY